MRRVRCLNLLALEDHATAFAGGQERSLYEVLRLLVARGHEVFLCYRKAGELLSGYQKAGIEPKALLAPVDGTGIRLHHVLQLWYETARRGVNLIYVNRYFDVPLGALVSIMSRVPLVCHLRLPCPHYLSRRYRWGLSRCKRIITISEHTRRTYIAAGIEAQRIRVVYNGVDVSEFSPQGRPGDSGTLRVSYFGRLCPTKGVEVLIQAFRLFERTQEDVVLCITGDVRGDGIDRSYLYDLHALTGSSLNRTIFFSPHTDNVRFELSRSELVILPSIWEEPFGRIIIEAMACEVPVIASRVGGIPEILGEGFPDQLVTPGDPDVLCDAITKFVRWRQERPDLGRKSRALVTRKFKQEDRLSEIEELLRDVISPANADGH